MHAANHLPDELRRQDYSVVKIVSLNDSGKLYGFEKIH